MTRHGTLHEFIAVWVAASVALGAFCVLGCGQSRTIDADSLATAQQSYDAALVEIEAGNHESALTSLESALAPGGGLPPDIHTDARVQRAICLARLGRCEEAHEDLNVAAEGAADMAAVHVARSFIYKKENDPKKSKAELTAAKKIDRQSKAIKE